ncbi:MAG: PGPGW domain-containing protein [Pirellulales bacterium]
MEWIESLIDWAKANDTLLSWLFALSIALFLLTPVAVTWAIVRLPADYFTRERRRPLASWEKYPMLRLLLLIVKNALGIVLVIAGLLMLVVPGQGLLTLAVGLVLLDFPGKFRLERWLATRPSVWRSLNWLRKRAGRKPLKKPA